MNLRESVAHSIANCGMRLSEADSLRRADADMIAMFNHLAANVSEGMVDAYRRGYVDRFEEILASAKDDPSLPLPISIGGECAKSGIPAAIEQARKEYEETK